MPYFVAMNSKLFHLKIWIAFSLFLTYITHKLFYNNAEFIYKFNTIVDPGEISPPLRGWYVEPRDGIEPLVLYIAMTMIVLISVVFAKITLLNIFNNKKFLLSAQIILVCTLIYLLSGATYLLKPPPFAKTLKDSSELFHLLLFQLLTCTTLVLLYVKNYKLFISVASLISIPICFIGISVIEQTNYGYIIDPALRIINNFSLHEIYFQYDLLLSLVVLPFLYFKAEIYNIQFVFQFSYYIFFISMIMLSRSIFINKVLTVFLLISLLIFRFYALQHDATYIPQLTPLRLDLWIIPITLFWKFGKYHWSVGLSLSLLIVLHRNLGIIYFAAYGLCLALICLSNLKKLILPTVKSIILPIVGLVVSMAIFRDFGISHAAKIYGSFGFGFDRIQVQSFYWYVPFLVSITSIIIFKIRNLISTKYFEFIVFLIFLCIGNSLYFFGRSHESNLFAISATILFLLFIFIDLLMIYIFNDMLRSKCVNLVKISLLSVSSGLIILYLTLYYSDYLREKIKLQFENLITLKLYQIYNSKYDLTEIKQLTNNSQKIHAMSDNFHIYYDGNYVPQSYWFPYSSHVYVKAQIHELQSYLDSGYYLIYDIDKVWTPIIHQEIIDKLKFNQHTVSNKIGVLHFNNN